MPDLRISPPYNKGESFKATNQDSEESNLSRNIWLALFLLSGLVVAVVIVFNKTEAFRTYEGLKSTFEKDTSNFRQRFIANWSDENPDANHCIDMGKLLRELVRKNHYKYKLYLVLPHKTKDGYTIISDTGTCWENGVKGKVKLTSPAEVERLFFYGKLEEGMTMPPFENYKGKWSMLPIEDDNESIWGLLFAYHYGK